MKEKFINELREVLKENNVNDIDSVIEKYSNYYDFGIEAGLSEEEIFEKMGTLNEIAFKYKNQEEEKKSERKSISKDLIVFSLNDDIVIQYGDTDGIDIDFIKIKPETYQIINNSDKIEIKFPKYIRKTLFKSSGTIKITIPYNTKFNNVAISVVSGDFNLEEIVCDNFKYTGTSGDVKIGKINANNAITFISVSGDIKGEAFASKELNIKQVSGDMIISRALTDSLVISSVSGDIEIEDCEYITKKVSTVSGDVYINDEKSSTNLGDMFKEW